jgi:hypothetical protein
LLKQIWYRKSDIAEDYPEDVLVAKFRVVALVCVVDDLRCNEETGKQHEPILQIEEVHQDKKDYEA